MPARRHSGRVREAVKEMERPFTSSHDPAAGDGSAGAKASRDDPLAAALAEAAEKGYAEGRRKAVEEFDAEVESFRAEMVETLKRFAELEDSMKRRWEAVLLEIALEASSRIVRDRIDAGDPVTVRALREAMESLPAVEGLRARLHPSDLEAVASGLASEIQRGGITLVPDPGITRGGCVVESPVGTIDATIEASTELVRSAAQGSEGSP